MAVNPPALAEVLVDSGEKRRLTDPPANSFGDFHPRIAPDGQSMAFVRLMGTGVGEVVTIPFPPRQDEKPTAAFRSSAQSLAWSADGRDLIVSTILDGVRTLARVSASGNEKGPRLIAGVGDGAESPSVSRGGGRLAYLHGLSRTSIWKASLDPAIGSETKLTSSTRSQFQPEVSPDGRKIVFSSDRSGAIEIWTADFDGSNPSQITTGATAPLGASWSPDGQKILFTGRPAGNVDIYQIDAQGGAPRRITTHPNNDVWARFSRDGKWIYFASNRTGRFEIWKTPADGPANETQVTHNGGWVHRESPDGKFLHYVKLDIPGLWKMPAEGGEEIKVLDENFVNYWTMAGNSLYLPTADGLGFRRLDLRTGKAVVIPAVLKSKLRVGRISVTPDEKWVVFERDEPPLTELMLVENFR
jgi:Tol biopolymer transport system component